MSTDQSTADSVEIANETEIASREKIEAEKVSQPTEPSVRELQNDEIDALDVIVGLLQKTVKEAVISRICQICDLNDVLPSGFMHQFEKRIREGVLPHVMASNPLFSTSQANEIVLSQLTLHQLIHLTVLFPEFKQRLSVSEYNALLAFLQSIRDTYFELRHVEKDSGKNDSGKLNNKDLLRSLLESCKRFYIEDCTIDFALEFVNEGSAQANDPGNTKSGKTPSDIVSKNQAKQFKAEFEADEILVSEYLKHDRCTIDSDVAKSIFGAVSKQGDLSVLKGDTIQKQLRRFLTCEFCRTILKDPRTLPCLHSYCCICLKRKISDKMIGCPKCEKFTQINDEDSVDRFPINDTLATLTKCLSEWCVAKDLRCRLCILPPVALCFECSDVYCENHKALLYHFGHPAVQRFECLLDEARLRSVVYRFCPAHKKELIELCSGCLSVLCADEECRRAHQKHGLSLPTLSAYKHFLGDLAELQQRMDAKLALSDKKTKAAHQNQESIEKYFADIINVLERQKQKFLEDTETAAAECLSRDEKSLESLRIWVQTAQSIRSQFEACGGVDHSVGNLPELMAARSKLLRHLAGCADGAMLRDENAISYPEGRLRVLLQSAHSLSSNIVRTTISQSWEAELKLPGLKNFCVDSQHIYVLKKPLFSHQVWSYLLSDPNAAPVLVCESSHHGFQAIAVDRVGNLTVVEDAQSNLEVPSMKMRRNVTVHVFAKVGKQKLRSFTIEHLNKYDSRICVKWNSRNFLLVSDGSCVCEFDPRGELKRKFNFHSLVDVVDFFHDPTVDVLFVSDKTKNSVLIFNSKQHVMKTIGELGVTPGNFIDPSGLARDVYGHLFVCDAGNNRIQVFDGEGTFLKLIPYPAALKELSLSRGSSNASASGFALHELHACNDCLFLFDPASDVIWRYKYF